MTSRLYFFREEDEYDVEEMVSRITVGDIRNTTSEPVKHVIENSPVSAQDLQKKEQELHSLLQSKLGFQGYRRFIKDIFEYCGEKGDKFNLQIYTGAGMDYDELLTNAKKKQQGLDPDELVGKKIEKSLIQYEERGSNVLDLRFVLAEDYSVTIVSDDGEENEVYRSQPSFVEARVYTDKNIVVLSNRQLDDDEKLRVRRTVQDWTGGTISSGPDLMENELLALQNYLNGENSGIDYGDFNEDSISTAKYRGERNLALSRSRIVQPAKQDGRIVALQFYRQYGSGNHERDVLVRIHRDGHLTASKPTEPDFIDEIVSALTRLRKHREFWNTLNSQIESYIDELMVRSLIKGVKNYKSKKHQATGANVNEFVEDNEYQIVEVQLYEAVLFNIGCKLIELQINGNLPDVDTADKDPRQKDELRGLFNDFAEYEIDSPHYDFEHIWDHLYALLSSDYSSSLELIEEATQRYRI